MREELKEGNRSIFSRRLKALIEERLEKREQVMLFINRRGYANFVSCRSCGEAVRCPSLRRDPDTAPGWAHDVPLLRLPIPQPKKCPVCGSPYIAPFGTGTQKIEAMAAELFPKARILRMDLDTTSKKGGHQEILSSFARGEADILIGTQMIVKGHDFSKVTLVGALAADLSLYASDYRCGEQTFALLTQAAGRAGRGQLAGNVVIQTYQPDHYSIRTAATQDYESFYSQEMAYRRLLGYPPAVAPAHRADGVSCRRDPGADSGFGGRVGAAVGGPHGEGKIQGYKSFRLIGPVNAAVYKVNDIYRKILYIKHENYDILIQIRKMTEEGLKGLEGRDGLTVQYDLT